MTREPRESDIDPQSSATGVSAENGQGSGPSAEDLVPQEEPGEPEESSERAEAKKREELERDHTLVRGCQAGDEQAFADLVARHEGRAFRVARNMVPSDEDARDLCQEAFLRVFRNIERFDFKHGFATWLYRIVTNLCIDFLRKRRPTFSTSGASEDGEDEHLLDVRDEHVPDPSQRLESSETVSAVRDCINGLAPHFQAVLVLRELEGLACTEIAEVVGATHVTVRWRLHRGRKLFQEEWERRARNTNSSDEPTNTPEDPS